MLRALRFAFIFGAVCSSSMDGVCDELSGERLTFDGVLKRDVVFWPGSGALVYAAEDVGTGRVRLYKIHLDSGKIESFHNDRGLADREIAVTPDGETYAYLTINGLSSKIVVQSREPARQITVPYAGADNWQNWPSLSPEGAHVIFTEGASAIYSYNLSENKGKASLARLSMKDASYSDLWPKFSPDGKRVVFASRRDNDFELYVMNANGTGQTRLTQSPGIDARPTFSPDGNRLAFTSNRDGNYEVYVMQTDGSAPTRITHNPERDDHACWAPDGRSLVIVSERAGEFDLYRIELPQPSP